MSRLQQISAQLITSAREPPPPQTKSIHWGLLGIWVKYNVFVPFLFIYLYLFSETRIQAMDFFVLWALSPEINLI